MKSKTILIVEDNPSDAELAIRALKRNNVINPVQVVVDGGEAIDYLFGRGKFIGRDTSALPGLVLLDLNLPDISGIEVLKTIRETDFLRELLVIVLTSSLEKKDVEECYRNFANSYLRKPVDFLEFSSIIKLISDYWIGTNVPPAALRVNK